MNPDVNQRSRISRTSNRVLHLVDIGDRQASDGVLAGRHPVDEGDHVAGDDITEIGKAPVEEAAPRFCRSGASRLLSDTDGHRSAVRPIHAVEPLPLGKDGKVGILDKEGVGHPMPFRPKVAHAHILVVLDIPLASPGAGILVYPIGKDRVILHFGLRLGRAPREALDAHLVGEPRGVDRTHDAVYAEIDRPADTADLYLGARSVVYPAKHPVMGLDVGRARLPILRLRLKAGLAPPEVLGLGDQCSGCLDCPPIAFGHLYPHPVAGWVKALHPLMAVVDAQMQRGWIEGPVARVRDIAPIVGVVGIVIVKVGASRQPGRRAPCRRNRPDVEILAVGSCMEGYRPATSRPTGPRGGTAGQLDRIANGVSMDVHFHLPQNSNCFEGDPPTIGRPGRAAAVIDDRHHISPSQVHRPDRATAEFLEGQAPAVWRPAWHECIIPHQRWFTSRCRHDV